MSDISPVSGDWETLDKSGDVECKHPQTNETQKDSIQPPECRRDHENTAIIEQERELGDPNGRNVKELRGEVNLRLG